VIQPFIRAAPVFSLSTIQTREDAASFAFFFSAKDADLDANLSEIRLDKKLSNAVIFAFVAAAFRRAFSLLYLTYDQSRCVGGTGDASLS